jgi:NADP-dependent 3-hydroxy acid dehydrogenase YdfG
MDHFRGRTALVTGAASGIGAALVRRLRSCGARVITTDVQDGADHRLDVRDLEGFAKLIGEVGVPDLLFANAGLSTGGPTHEITRAHWDRTIDVNLNGVVNGILAVYPGMVERGAGHIVVTASAAGLVAPPFVTAYSATKHAVVGLALGLRAEAALRGVQVSVLCPGAVETPGLDTLPAKDLPATATAPLTARRYLSLVGNDRSLPTGSRNWRSRGSPVTARSSPNRPAPACSGVFTACHRHSSAASPRSWPGESTATCANLANDRHAPTNGGSSRRDQTIRCGPSPNQPQTQAAAWRTRTSRLIVFRAAMAMRV